MALAMPSRAVQGNGHRIPAARSTRAAEQAKQAENWGHLSIHFVTAHADSALQNTSFVALLSQRIYQGLFTQFFQFRMGGDPGCHIRRVWRLAHGLFDPQRILKEACEQAPWLLPCATKITTHLRPPMPPTHALRSNKDMARSGHRTTRESAIRRLLDWFWGSVEAEFESGYLLEESVWRLAVATEGRFFNGRPGGAKSGRVSIEGVSLQKMTPTSESTMPALYIGAFQEAGGRVWLKGRFHMPKRLRIDMAIWFAFFLVLAAGVAAPRLVAAEPVPEWLLATGVGLLAAGLGSVVKGRRQSMDDIPRLANVIANALSGTPESYEGIR
jgi:hypothetical protein